VKFSTSLVKFGSVGDLALELKKALTAISAGWNVEHNPDGTHKARTVAVETTQTTVGAAGGATALPATPKGYAVLTVNGTEYVVPYYPKA
jgi:hypothetical protein